MEQIGKDFGCVLLVQYGSGRCARCYFARLFHSALSATPVIEMAPSLNVSLLCEKHNDE